MLKVVSTLGEGLLREQLSFETLLSEILSRFVNIPSHELDRGVEDALRLICKELRLDQSRIFLRDPGDRGVFVLSYVFRDPELPPPPNTLFTAVGNFPWCNKKLMANEMICLPDTQAAPMEAAADKASWKRDGVRSALVIPLCSGRQNPAGFWTVESIREQRDWPELMRNRLKLLAGVFADALARAHAERQLRESEARLRLAANTTGAGFWTIDAKTAAIWATPKLQELFGLAATEFIDVPRFLALICAEDRGSVEDAIHSMMAGEEVSVEYRINLPSRPPQWVLSRGKLYEFEAGKPVLMGITFDITERRGSEQTLRSVSGRLIAAQEEERKRIARELHDAVGQQIAVIAMEVQQLATARQADVQGKADQLFGEVQKLAHTIQALSRELHSSSLEYLGLVPAIDGLCQQLRHSHSLEVDFRSKGVPKRLPSDVGLAAFRITQEALHNVLKHSGQKKVQVMLEGGVTTIHLTIRDHGKGFEVSEATRGRGLGLISMRERALALNGQVTFLSRPGEGTEVRVQLPIANVHARPGAST